MKSRIAEAKRVLQEHLDSFAKAMEDQVEEKSHTIEGSGIGGYLQIQTAYICAKDSLNDLKLVKKFTQGQYGKIALGKVELFLEGKLASIPSIPKTVKELLVYPMEGY